MERRRIPAVVTGADGGLLGGASVVVRATDGGEAAVYAGADGADTLAQPLDTDAGGGVPGWVEPGGYEVSTDADGATVHGAAFRAGPGAEPRPLALADGWIDLDGYARSTVWAADGTVALAGVLARTPDAPSAVCAVLPGDARPKQPVELPTLLGFATPHGTEVRPAALLALPDGRVRAPDEPFRWLLVNAEFAL
jgi:hypothetical protein